MQVNAREGELYNYGTKHKESPIVLKGQRFIIRETVLNQGNPIRYDHLSLASRDILFITS